MSIDAVDFDEVTEASIRSLVAAETSEGLRLEFKRQTYVDSHDDTRELLKDVSCLADASGGHLIIGVAETNGVAESIVPIPSNVDSEVTRLWGKVNSSIEPRILGLRLRPIPMAGGHLIVFRVPKSWQAPHRVTYRGLNKFYVRNPSGVHEASLDELRAMFLQSSNAHAAVKEFRNERIESLRSQPGFAPVDPKNGLFVLHIVPLSFASSLDTVDIPMACANRGDWKPILATDFEVRPNFDGVISIRMGASPPHGYVQLLRSGAIEEVKGSILRRNAQGEISIRVGAVESWTEIALKTHLPGLQRLGVTPPLVIMVSLIFVKGSWLGESVTLDQDGDRPNPFDRGELLLPAITLTDYTDEGIDDLCRPAYEAFWNAAGYLTSRLPRTQGP